MNFPFPKWVWTIFPLGAPVPWPFWAQGCFLPTLLEITVLTIEQRPAFFIIYWIGSQPKAGFSSGTNSGSCQNKLDRMTHNVPYSGHGSSGSSIKRQNCGMFMPPFFSLNAIIFFSTFVVLFVWVRFFSELGAPWRSLPSSPPYHSQVCWYLLWQIQKMYSNFNPAGFEISLNPKAPAWRNWCFYHLPVEGQLSPPPPRLPSLVLTR